MLESIILENFQIHEYLEILFDPYITTLVGKTASGKSAVIRALKWLSLNQSPKRRFINYNSDKVKVILKLDKHEIVREKNLTTTNLYYLDKKEFKSFSTSVPDPIADLLNIGEENFHCQHDRPYFLMLTSGQVGKALNQVVNLEIIDSTLANINSETKKAKIAVELDKERLKTAREEKSKLTFVGELDTKLKSLELKEKKLQEIRKRKSYLCTLLEDIREASKKSNKNVDKLISRFSSLEDKYKKLDSLKDKKQDLNSLLSKIKKVKEETSCLTIRQEKLEKDLSKIETCPLCQNPMK